MANFTLQQLRDELDNDPSTIGYNVDHGIAAGQINTQNLTLTPEIRTDTVRGVIRPNALGALDAAHRDQLDFYLAGETLQANSNVRSKLISQKPGANNWWPSNGAGNNTVADITAILSTNGSRAEELWGIGTVVKERDVLRARAL